MATKGKGRQELADAIGLREDKTLSAIRNLIRRNILTEDGDFIDINPNYLSRKTEASKPGRRFSKDAWEIARYLADSIEFWKPGYLTWKTKISKNWQTSWARDIDKLVKAGIGVNEIKHVIDGIKQDKDQEHKGPQGFSWRRNILSGKKLHEKWELLFVRYGIKSNKPIREKRYYDNDPLKPGEKMEDWEHKGEDVDPVF